jgi:hypothetical protein
MTASSTSALKAIVLLAMSMSLAADNAPEPQVQDLGGGRYRIGTIEVDKETRKFTVPGTVIALADGAPIEFLAISRGGSKDYESLVELDVSAVEFNLACILIGLDGDKAVRPQRHFDPVEVTGDVVDVRISWLDEEGEREMEIERLLKDTTDAADHVWVYTGSTFLPDERYLAELMGTLIGVVHDPGSIIQHQRGLGLGNYGAVTMDPDTAPPGGTPVKVTVFSLPPDP